MIGTFPWSQLFFPLRMTTPTNPSSWREDRTLLAAPVETGTSETPPTQHDRGGASGLTSISMPLDNHSLVEQAIS